MSWLYINTVLLCVCVWGGWVGGGVFPHTIDPEWKNNLLKIANQIII